MTINNARGSHSSPGVYSKEVDVTYSEKSLGITSLGVAGEALKGPAFEPIKVQKWTEYTDYFGGTSTEKFKGNGLPKFEMPYIAKEYLKESKELYVCRVLGLSGYDAGKAFLVTAKGYDNSTKDVFTAASETEKESVLDLTAATKDYVCVTAATSSTDYTYYKKNEYVIATLRSNASYTGDASNPCEVVSGDEKTWSATAITISPYNEIKYDANCSVISVATGETTGATITKDNLGKFTIGVNGKNYPVSLNAGDKDYIYKKIGSDPVYGPGAPVFVEEVYDYAILKHIAEMPLQKMEVQMVTTATSGVSSLSDYKEAYRCGRTPWIISEVNAVTSGEVKKAFAKRLFRAYTISDGDSSNKEVKLSIQNVRPDAGTFDLVIRSMYDTDAAPVVLEKFAGCDLVKGSKNYVALRVGTYDGEYELKSKYIALEMNEDGEISTSVPCGFEGYPMHDFGDSKLNLPACYNCEYDYNVKAKRQFFGMSNLVGIDEDILSYKGKQTTASTEMSDGFHLDSIVNQFGNKIEIDGEDFNFQAVKATTGKAESQKIPRIITEEYAKGTLYEDVATRKFTLCFYGGFDGWDIYRTERTIQDKFKATKYNGQTYTAIGETEAYLNLPNGAINSDYYAYLGAYRQFANPEAFDINVFATPGIDYVNNELLVEDALDMVEDTDDGRAGDALYIVTSPNDINGEMYTASEIVEQRENTSIDSSYIATYWPWVKCFDSDDNVYINLPVTKDVVRNLAYVDNTSYPWFAPAGVNRGDVDCVRATLKTKLADEDTLYDGMINPVKTFAVDGVKIWGNKTMYSVDSPLNRVNVRRLMLRVKKLVSSVSKQLIFDQQDDSLKDQFLNLVTPILSSVKSNRGISDYKIAVEDSAEARDAHTLPAKISVKPIGALEYVDLTFTIYPESVEFDD